MCRAHAVLFACEFQLYKLRKLIRIISTVNFHSTRPTGPSIKSKYSFFFFLPTKYKRDGCECRRVGSPTEKCCTNHFPLIYKLYITCSIKLGTRKQCATETVWNNKSNQLCKVSLNSFDSTTSRRPYPKQKQQNRWTYFTEIGTQSIQIYEYYHGCVTTEY